MCSILSLRMSIISTAYCLTLLVCFSSFSACVLPSYSLFASPFLIICCFSSHFKHYANLLQSGEIELWKQMIENLTHSIAATLWHHDYKELEAQFNDGRKADINQTTIDLLNRLLPNDNLKKQYFQVKSMNATLSNDPNGYNLSRYFRDKKEIIQIDIELKQDLYSALLDWPKEVDSPFPIFPIIPSLLPFSIFLSSSLSILHSQSILIIPDCTLPFRIKARSVYK